MKRFTVFIIILVILGAAIFIKPALTFLVRKQLEKALLGSDVRIGTCGFMPLKQLVFFDIEIKKQKTYDFRIKQASISYSLFSLLNGNILKLELKDVSLGPVAVKDLELSDIHIKLKPEEASVLGNLSIPQIKYNKAKISNIHAKLRLKDKILFLDSLTAQIFDGKVEVSLSLNMDKGMDYEAALNFINLDIDRLIRDFDLKEKFQMTGALGGKVFLTGSGSDINSVEGALASTGAGGLLTITDKRFLGNLARTSQQSLDILLESFKNYHYNRGIVKLGMEKGNLVLDVHLDGEAGKRNLSIVVHDFN
ncbi:MAG: YdbH domain-containing protein [Candidatus Omnitrophota bacterium]